MPSKKAPVLIVDDDVRILGMKRRALEMEGHRVNHLALKHDPSYIHVIPISLVEGIVTLLGLITLELGQLYLSSGRSSMPVIVKGETYYRTSEVCAMVGVSRSTLLRWLRDGILRDVPPRDRRGWRLFATSQIDRLKQEADRIC